MADSSEPLAVAQAAAPRSNCRLADADACRFAAERRTNKVRRGTLARIVEVVIPASGSRAAGAAA